MDEKKSNKFVIAIGLVLMIAVIISLDVLFFRHRFWERLLANITVVLVFAAVYFKYLRRL